MIDKPAHVTDEAAALLHAGDEARIRYILSKPWVHYPKAKQIVDLVHGLLRYPRTTRMPSIAVYGDSGMGKSMIVGRFKQDDAFLPEADSGMIQRKSLVVELSGGPGERRLYAQILTALGAPHNPRSTIVGLEQTTLRLLHAVGVQVLLIDEIHNIIAGSWREQRVILNTLRFLSNEAKLSLVCSGITEAREAINGDVQLARRLDVLTLPRWKANDDFQQLVLAIIRNFPLRQPSVLTAGGLKRVLRVTGGVTSKIFRLLNEVAIEAIETSTEQLTDAAVEKWRPLSEEEAAFQ
jgi:hypothetical protein